MSPSAVTPVVSHEKHSAAAETSAAEATVADNAGCIPQYAQHVAKTPKYRLSPVMADRFIAAIAMSDQHQIDINI
jgi:hypothetical protein